MIACSPAPLRRVCRRQRPALASERRQSASRAATKAVIPLPDIRPTRTTSLPAETDMNRANSDSSDSDFVRPEVAKQYAACEVSRVLGVNPQGPLG